MKELIYVGLAFLFIAYCMKKWDELPPAVKLLGRRPATLRPRRYGR